MMIRFYAIRIKEQLGMNAEREEEVVIRPGRKRFCGDVAKHTTAINTAQSAEQVNRLPAKLDWTVRLTRHSTLSG